MWIIDKEMDKEERKRKDNRSIQIDVIRLIETRIRPQKNRIRQTEARVSNKSNTKSKIRERRVKIKIIGITKRERKKSKRRSI